MMAMATRENFGVSPIKFEAVFFTSRKRPADTDNYMKSALDGIAKSGVFANDIQVVEVHAYRVKSENPRAEIVITETEELTELQGDDED